MPRMNNCFGSYMLPRNRRRSSSPFDSDSDESRALSRNGYGTRRGFEPYRRQYERNFQNRLDQRRRNRRVQKKKFVIKIHVTFVPSEVSQIQPPASVAPQKKVVAQKNDDDIIFEKIIHNPRVQQEIKQRKEARLRRKRLHGWQSTVQNERNADTPLSLLSNRNSNNSPFWIPKEEVEGLDTSGAPKA